MSIVAAQKGMVYPRTMCVNTGPKRIMSAEKSFAIVIRTVEFSESSYVATLYTESFGKITALAKGARRAKSAFENALDLLSISRVVFLRKSSHAMDLLTEARLERRFRAAARDTSRLYAAFYVAELLNALTGECDPDSELYRVSKQTLITLDEGGDVGYEVLRFEMALLGRIGQMPSLDQCIECGNQVDIRGRVAFDQLAGGVLCYRCRPGHRHVASLSEGAMQLMRQLIKNAEAVQMQSAKHDRALDQALHDSDVGKKERRVRGELRGLMNHRIRHLLGRHPRTPLVHPY